MRDEDVQSQRMTSDELRDIHHRIDALKSDSERQYEALTSKLHSLEVAVARGSRFPPAAMVAALSIVLAIVGQATVLYGKLETTHHIASQALTSIVEHRDQMTDRMRAAAQLEERVKQLEGRIVGLGPNGWHRSDHEEYAKRIDLQHAVFSRRLDIVELKQEELCERVRNCGGARK